MKKLFLMLVLLAAMLTLCAASLADEAANLTDACTFKVTSSGKKYTLMTDGKYTTKWESNKSVRPAVTITAPADQPIYGMYLCLATMPESYEIQVELDGKWVKYCDGNTDYYHNYTAFPEGLTRFRIQVTQDKKFVLGINEIYLLGEGDLPDWVQIWEPTLTDVDLLVVATHPDDDLLFFGGLISTYGVERTKKVAVAYFTYSNTTRRSELLNGLWTMGIRNYPVIGTFADHYDKSLDAAYKTAGGKAKVNSWVVSLIRQTRPQVIVTHGEGGEYGHKQHMLVADAVKNGVVLAASETACPESIPLYGTWDTPKTYLHEYAGGTQVSYDWGIPLTRCDGLTATEVTQSAYALHITQRAAGFILSDTGVTYKKKFYDNHTYGLYRSTVGDDVACDDVLEHVASLNPMLESVHTTPAPTATPAPAWEAEMPALNERGFLDEGEFCLADDTNGIYIYVNQTTRIVIERKYDATQPLTWFEAEIWSDVEAGEMLQTLFFDDAKKGKVRVDAAKNAVAHKAVFAMNTDYYTYRIGSSRRTGVVIRNGELLIDDPYTEPKTLFPNLDTIAFYPDGRLEVAHSYEHTGKWFIENGAVNVYSFGPYLIRDGVVNSDLYEGNNLTSKNPRCAIGMVEPGHYVMILCEGRLKRSGGVTMNQLALMMKKKGATQAINLDGGQTAVMCFMGKQLNQIGKYDGKTNARETCDILCIGTSDMVGNTEFR